MLKIFEGNQHLTPTEYGGQKRALTFIIIRLHFKQLRDRKGKIGENQLAKMSETGAGRWAGSLAEYFWCRYIEGGYFGRL